MKSRRFSTKHVIVGGLGLAFALTAAQSRAQTLRTTPPPPHYAVTDLGTLNNGSFSLAYGVNNKGEVDGFSTFTPSNPPNAVPVTHAFFWEHGVMIDLGTLGGPDSQSFAPLNERALIPGSSEPSATEKDPNGEDFCGFNTQLVCLPFVWRNGVMFPLPTLGGNNGQAAAVNDRGPIMVGYAETTKPDPACPPAMPNANPPVFGQVQHFLPTVWVRGKIGRLPLYKGDADGGAFWINNRFEVIGASGTCGYYDGRYGVALQPDHALLWRVRPGGDSSGSISSLERRIETIDLGNLGGKHNNAAFSINDRGEIVGASDLAGDQYQNAFLWRHGKMYDLRTLSGDVISAAVAINNKSQATGVSIDAIGNLRGFLWQNGTMYDLNTLIPANSPLYILHGFGINDAGQIAGFAFDAVSGNVEAVLLTPVDDWFDSGEESVRPGVKVVLPEHARRTLQKYLHYRNFAGVRQPN